MAKNKLSFDAIFEGNDIKEDAKKRISAMLEDVVATRMEAKDEDEEDEDDEKIEGADNSMTEDADDLAVRLRLQARGRKFAAKFDNWTVTVGGRIKYTLKQLTKMGADVSFIQDDAYDPAEYADEKFVMNIKTQEPLIVPNGNGKPIKWTSFEDPNPNLDEDDEEDGEKKMEAEAMDPTVDDEKDPEDKESEDEEMDPTVDDGEEEDEEVYEEGDADAATDLKSQLSGFMKDDPELLRAFRTGFENPAKARLSLAQMATDLSSNKAAEPATNFVLLLLRWLADKSNAVNMFTQWVKQQKASPDPMMDADDGPINNEYSEAFTNKLDKYLTYVAEEWAENNKIALENGIKVQIAESFLSNMKGMYEQYNFKNIPTRDMVVELGTKVTEAEQKLNEQIEKNAQLRSKYNKQRKEMLVIESSKGLTATQVEKFKKLTEDVAFEDEKSFKNKVAVIKENAFTKTVVKSDTKLETETGPQEELLHENTRMSKYVDTISRSLKF